MSGKKVMGVYVIETRDRDNKKRYVGMSQNIKKRWRHHRNKLHNNRHPNTLLQNAWNEYGKKQFRFKIIKLCETREEMCYFEKLYAEEFGYGDYDKCFNIGEPGIDTYKE